MLKKVKCSGPGCEYVVRWTTMKVRGPQYIEVPDDFEGKAYCSIECQLYDKEVVKEENANNKATCNC